MREEKRADEKVSYQQVLEIISRNITCEWTQEELIKICWVPCGLV